MAHVEVHVSGGPAVPPGVHAGVISVLLIKERITSHLPGLQVDPAQLCRVSPAGLLLFAGTHADTAVGKLPAYA